MKKILVITSSIDYTVDYIINKYGHDCNFFRFNTDLFSEYSIALTNEGFTIKSETYEIDSASISAVYYRKPTLPDLNDYDNKYKGMMMKDILHVIEGLVEQLDCKILTSPYILRKAENKAYQMNVAKQIGFTIPEYLITNSQNMVKEFINDNRMYIIKPLSVGRIINDDKAIFFQTNTLDGVSEFHNIELSPIFIQEYIEKDYEIRLTVIEDDFYPVMINSTNAIDWRKEDSINRYSLVEIPREIKEMCQLLMQELELSFGAFDFIVHKEVFYFLEVNPNGQWLWLESELDLDISKKIVLAREVYKYEKNTAIHNSYWICGNSSIFITYCK